MHRRLTVTTSGTLTLSEMLSVVERQASEGAWTYGVLYVPRELVSYPTTAEMRALAARVQALTATLGPRGPVAIVEPRTAAFGMWRMYEMLVDETLTIHVFRNLETADAWLTDNTSGLSRRLPNNRKGSP